MATTGVACDLCELHRDLTWLIRTDAFAVGAADAEGKRDDMTILAEFGQDEEWALCRACERDVKEDHEDAIMRRRRQAFLIDTPSREWDSLDLQAQAYVLQTLDMTVMAVLSCRQKAWGRAWTPQDAQQAAEGVQRDGGRGVRHSER